MSYLHAENLHIGPEMMTHLFHFVPKLVSVFTAGSETSRVLGRMLFPRVIPRRDAKKTVCIKLIMTIRRISCLSWYQSIIPYYILHITRRFQYHRLNDSAYTCSPFFLTGARPLEAPIPGRITGSASIDTLVRVGLEKQYGTRTPMVVLHDFFPCVDDELSVKRNQASDIF